MPAQHTLDSMALRHSKQPLDEAEYWTEGPIDRLAWAAHILRQLDQRGWPNKSDIGWSDYDVEIYGSRWSTLQLTTVTTDFARGKQSIRCRLRARWSLQAKVAFWSLCGFELLVLGFVGPSLRWLAHLTRRWHGLCALLVCTLAEGDHRARHPLVREVAGAAREVLRLAPLTRDATCPSREN